LNIVSWAAGEIKAQVPSGAVTGQLVIRRADSQLTSVNAVTVTVGTQQPVYALQPSETIQHAIDNQAAGTTILVPPGTYDELVIMWKPVRLQGWGEGTIINALKVPAEKLVAWRTAVASRVAANQVTLLPGQIGTVDPADGEPALFSSEEGPGIIVLARNAPVGAGGFGLYPAAQGGLPNARIDGMTVTGGDAAGAIFVNAFARRLQISNMRLNGNNGSFGGGIRVGHAVLTTQQANALVYPDAQNGNIVIKNNQIVRNGGLGGAGGGISLYTGSDNYRVQENWICGNYSQGGGGGIGHLGLSPGGLIEKNRILLNESFYQMSTVNGGGILVSGAVPLAGSPLSPGAGTVRIVSNLILRNSAGAGDGGGIALVRVSGADVTQAPGAGTPKHQAILVNNILANNVAALAGGAISLQDTPLAQLLHLTVTRNDSTATAGDAFAAGSPNRSTAQPAGIVSRKHSPELLAALSAGQPQFSSPTLRNSIIRENRSFYFLVDPTLPAPGFGLQLASSSSDLGVLPSGTGTINAQSCMLSGSPDPLFVVSAPFNESRGQTIVLPGGTTALQAAPAFDEGGNYIRVSFGQLTLLGDYHLQSTSPARASGQAISTPAEVLLDFDGNARPLPAATLPDIGADERL
jgi:hypothetical protein